MATLTDTVRPGDVISSDLMTRLIALVNAHEAALGTGGGGGGIVVPVLFGRTLGEARTSLRLQGLVLGTVVDAVGAIINTSGSAEDERMVLTQVPAGGAAIVAGGAVSLVVAAIPGGAPPPPPPPLALNLVVPGAARAGETVDLRGSGFAGTESSVTFGGVAGAVLGTSSSTHLFVTIPEGIPGAPGPGGADVPGIVIRVSNPDGASVDGTLTLKAPLDNPLSITAVAPDPALVGVPLNITGTGFTGVPSQNVVSFDNISVMASASTATQLTVAVPTNLPGLNQPGDFVFVNLTVTRTTDNAVSNIHPLEVDR